MAKEVSKTQLDRLGDRLRKGDISEVDLRLLDQFRRSFSDAYEAVVGTIRKELALEPTGRPAKSTTSIIEKLRRESIRLTQLQDIAGCRLIVQGIVEQDNVAQALARLFERTTIIDRRRQPSHGYRAVHVVVNHGGKMIEVQVRTTLQHLWAELSEKFSDVVDPAIKYGGGYKEIVVRLTKFSSLVEIHESIEAELQAWSQSVSQERLTDEIKHQIAVFHENMNPPSRGSSSSFATRSNLRQHLKEKRMQFLIEYDRHRGQIVTFSVFEDSEKKKAEDARLAMELELNRRGAKHEVVLLEAASEEALRRTHRRYFEDLVALASPPVQ
jgi:ppGpp synthetase/RelA/SpoT-type nucleotidyltranferase